MASELPSDALLKRRFDAAVDTIKNLPKNGSFQPSNALKLKNVVFEILKLTILHDRQRKPKELICDIIITVTVFLAWFTLANLFYSLYKQATQGAATGGRPSMFDLVGRAKWDAWKALDAMSAAEAMQAYVDEILTIAQSMSDSPEKEQFLAVMVETPAASEPAEVETVGSAPATDAGLAAGNVPVDSAIDVDDSTSGSALAGAPAGSGEDTSVLDRSHAMASAQNSTDSTLLVHRSATPSSMLSETDNEDEFCDVAESFTSDDDRSEQLAPSSSFMTSTPYIPFSAPPATAAAATTAAQPTTSLLGTALQPSTPVTPASDPAFARPPVGVVPYRNTAVLSSPPGSQAPATVGYISSQQLTGPGRAAALASPEHRHSASMESSVHSLCSDVASINTRLADVEAGLHGVKEGRPHITTVRERTGPRWWPFQGWSASTITSLLLWPFVVNYILALLFRRRQQGR